MPQEQAPQPLNQPRRLDRSQDENWIRAFLQRAAFGTLATAHRQQPFINTNLFIYNEEEHSIYMHTATEGRTRENVEHNSCVCFSVSEMGRLLPADTALQFSVEYAGVVVFGKATIIEDRKDARKALQMLLDKYAPHLQSGRDYRPITSDELDRTCVYRIKIESWSGKSKEVKPDFEGAYTYPIPEKKRS
jgi:uncharacterized protein